MTARPPDPAWPPAYRRKAVHGLALFAVTAFSVGGWLFSQAPHTRAAFEARTPHAQAPVKNIYLTPQITDTGKSAEAEISKAPVAATSGVSGGAGVMIGIVMTNLGLSEADTERAAEDLPPSVTLAFSPYGDLPKWLPAMKAEKRESLVLLPMEPRSYPKDDPGPRALLTRVSKEENEKILSALLRESAGASGMINFMGSEFLSDKPALLTTFSKLKSAGAMFVEDRGPAPAPSEAATVAAETGLPFLQTDVAIDSVPTETGVNQKLLELENIARTRGYAIGVATPYPVSFNMIKTWAAGLEARGVRLVPLSDLLKVAATRAAAPDQPQPSSPPVNAQ